MRHEPYRDYISRRMKEDKPEKTVDERDNEIFQLKQRIQRLETDMAHILKRHECPLLICQNIV